MVEDRIEKQDKELDVVTNKSLWMMVPRSIAFKFSPKQYHAQMKALIAQGAVSNSLYYYAGDGSLKRRLRLAKNALGHIKRFNKYSKVPD